MYDAPFESLESTLSSSVQNSIMTSDDLQDFFYQLWSHICTKLIIIITSESRPTLASVAIMPIHTGSTIQAWTGLALILFQLTVLSLPAGFTLTKITLHQRYTRV